MEDKRYKLLEKTTSAYLLFDKEMERYKVYDIEGDLVCSSVNEETAKNFLDSYDIKTVRKEKEANTESWIKEITS